jgi:hypothetical protein
MADDVLGHCCLGNVEAQLLKLSVNPRCPPQGVGRGHSADERADLVGDRWAAGSVPTALPGPDEPEAGPLPADDGVGLDDGEGLRPAVPQVGEEDPEQAVGRAQAWTPRGALQDCQLMAQREVLEHQGAVGPDHTEEADEDEGQHGGHHPSRPAGRSMVTRRTE